MVIYGPAYANAHLSAYAYACARSNNTFGGARMREREVETALVKAVKAAGGLCWKWVSPGINGVPDRIVLMPGMPAVFVELKAPGGKPTPLQLKRHEELRSRGFRVDIVNSKEAAKAYVEELMAE